MGKFGAKLIALGLAGALLLTACGQQYAKVLEIGGTPIAPGLYLGHQLTAFNQAQQKTPAAKTVADVLKADIDGKKAGEWIAGETLKSLTHAVFAQREFADRSLSFTEEETGKMKTAFDTYWKGNSAFYEKNGIGRASFWNYYEDGQKLGKVYEHYLAKDYKSPADSEVADYYKANYATMETLAFPKISLQTYAPLPADKLALVRAAADQAVKELNEGTMTPAQAAAKYLQDAFRQAGMDGTDAADKPEQFVQKQPVYKKDTQFNAAFLAELFAKGKNSPYGLSDQDSFLLVYRRVEDDALPAADSTAYKTMLEAMKSDAFETYRAAKEASYEIKKDEGAIGYYSPSKIQLPAEKPAA